jgi:hypothetical protein
MSIAPPAPPDAVLIETEDCTYSLEGGTVVCLPLLPGSQALVRNSICHAGNRLEVTRLNTGIVKILDPSPEKLLVISRTVQSTFRELERSSDFTFVAIEFGSQLTTIGPYSFDENGSLCSFFFPSTVQTVGKKSFCCCSRLGLFTYEPDWAPSLFESDQFAVCSDLRVVTIPQSVRRIRRECFSACFTLSLVLFEPDCEVALFEKRAFDECPALTSFFIPASVRVISESVFQGCHLAVVVFEAGSRLRFIHEGAFGWGFDLKEIHVPSRLAYHWQWFHDFDYELITFEDTAPEPEDRDEEEEEEDSLIEIDSEEDYEEIGGQRYLKGSPEGCVAAFREYLQEKGLDPDVLLRPRDSASDSE